MLIYFLAFVLETSANVEAWMAQTVTVTILSNDNAFGIISFVYGMVMI